MAISRFAGNFKKWDHVGNLTPLVEHSESERPHFNSKVATWLPISGSSNAIAMGFMVRWDKKVEDYYVVSSGKSVCSDRTGGLLPAGVRVAWDAAGSTDVVLTYTADDVAAGVINLSTGVAVTAAVTYQKAALELDLEEQGLITPTESLVDFLSHPLGLASYNYFKSAGSDLDNPATWTQTNYKMQDRPAILCDYVVRLPHVPSSVATTTIPAWSAAFAIANLDDANATSVWGTLATFKTEMNRYDDVTNANAVGLSVRFAPAASWTDRTALVIKSSSVDISSTVFLRERSSVTSVTAVGDYFWDAPVGVLWLYELGANALPTNITASDTLDFYHYRTAPTTVSTYACAVGNLKPGDLLMCDKFSNLATAATNETDITTAEVTAIVGTPTAATDAELASIANLALAEALSASQEAEARILGQVLGFVEHPRQALEKVRTEYNGLGTLDQMPGSASKGYPDTITYSSAADREVIINLIRR